MKMRLRTLHYKTFEDLSSMLFDLIKYQNCTTNYKGDGYLGSETDQIAVQKKRFIEIFTFWGE